MAPMDTIKDAHCQSKRLPWYQRCKIPNHLHIVASLFPQLILPQQKRPRNQQSFVRKADGAFSAYRIIASQESGMETEVFTPDVSRITCSPTPAHQPGSIGHLNAVSLS